MADVRPTPLLRRAGLFLLILLALTLVSVLLFVLWTEDSLDSAMAEDRPEQALVNPTHRPVIDFPVDRRSFDPAVNAFVDRFLRNCGEGYYSEFRRMFTRQIEPPSERRFISMFEAIKALRVIALERLPEGPGIPQPAYRLTAEYELEDFAAKGRPLRRVRLAVIQEDGEWALAPLPGDTAAVLDSLLSRTTQPAE